MPCVAILIEDNPTIRASLVPAMAEIADVQVVASAETAAHGIALLLKHQTEWRIAVVDLSLKDGNGFEVLRLFRRRGPAQRMIVLTNFATPELRRRALEAGADAVFDKSTEVDLFLERCAVYAAAVHAAG